MREECCRLVSAPGWQVPKIRLMHPQALPCKTNNAFRRTLESFRLGQVGEVSLLCEHAMHACRYAILIKPKWPGRPPNQAGSDWLSLLFPFSQAMSGSEALARQDAVKVEKWCAEQGVEKPADLAFFFLSYEEALNDAGRAVADAWKAVRATSTIGLASLARGLFKAEEEGRRAARPARPSSSRQDEPLVAVRPQPSSARPMALEKAQPAGIGYVHQMVALMLEGSSLAEGPSSSEMRNNIQGIAEDVCRRWEGATIVQASFGTLWPIAATRPHREDERLGCPPDSVAGRECTTHFASHR